MGRFRLTDILPSSWFYKKKPGSSGTAPPTAPPPPAPINHGRPSHYIPGNEEQRLSPLHPRAFDTKFLAAPSRIRSKRKPRRNIRPPPPPRRPPVVEPGPIVDLPPIQTKPKKEVPEQPPKSRPGRPIDRRSRRRGLEGSFPVVKSSADPPRDFRDSMVEMIVENGISSAAEMEELLACYLSLNSKTYHDVIVDVFKQIWLEMNRLRL